MSDPVVYYFSGPTTKCKVDPNKITDDMVMPIEEAERQFVELIELTKDATEEALRIAKGIL